MTNYDKTAYKNINIIITQSYIIIEIDNIFVNIKSKRKCSLLSHKAI